MTKILIDRKLVEQALEALERTVDCGHDAHECANVRAITALRAALAEPVQEHDLSRCPKCNGPADNGHDREVPPNPYYCTKCMAEPVGIVSSLVKGGVVWQRWPADMPDGTRLFSEVQP